MADFDRCILFVLYLEDNRLEGIVTNDPADAGGKTRFGIAANRAAWLPADFYDKPADEAMSDARFYYRRLYWNRICGDSIYDERVAAQFLSMAVNMGVGTATRIVQKVLGIAEDGEVGVVTLAHIAASIPGEFMRVFNAALKDHYTSIALKNPQDVKFLKGWFNRVDAIVFFPIAGVVNGLRR
jgi:lysozyme family protein